MPQMRPLLLVLLAALLAPPPMARAQDRPRWEILRPDPDSGRQGLRSPPPGEAPRVEEQPDQGRGDNGPELLTQDAAVALVRARHGGRVLRAGQATRDGRPVYQVRVLSPDGRVRDYEVDARTGQIR